MNNRSYTIIFSLLSCCILFILVVQGYWLRNFYLRETAAFDRNVYEALEKLTGKLQERKKLQAMKMTYFIVDGDTIAKTPSRNMKVETEHNVKVINKNSVSMSTKTVRRSKKTGSKTETVIIEDKDSLLIGGDEQNASLTLGGKQAQVMVYGKNGVLEKHILKGGQPFKEPAGVTELIDKMVMEIKVMDTETENSDTLASLIKRSLDNKGVLLPFEFSKQKLEKGKNKILARSKGFSEQPGSYRSDLSANNIISTNEYLYLQFPGKSNFVMAGIKSSLALSLIFSLVILGVFYYVMRLLLQQKKLSEIKNDFVNNMTHELKTPIATISLAVDGLSHPVVKSDPEKFEDYIRILKEENQKLNKHVERVLQVALLEKGELHLHRTILDPAAMIRRSIAGFSLQIHKQNAVVEFDPGETDITLYADEQHLLNVFNNLLDNALKYCSEECRIEIRITESAGKTIISFKDNGIGIDAQMKERIFEKFYRVQGGNLHDVKGFGLGLSYVRSIMEAHDGSIDLKSDKKNGSEFIITFPSYAG